MNIHAKIYAKNWMSLSVIFLLAKEASTILILQYKLNNHYIYLHIY